MEEVIRVEDCVSNIGDYDVPIHNAIIIPENATNGDMIKAMFPQYRYEEITYKICTSEDEWEVSSKKVRMHSEQIVDFESDWWNAPYKKQVVE